MNRSCVFNRAIRRSLSLALAVAVLATVAGELAAKPKLSSIPIVKTVDRASPLSARAAKTKPIAINTRRFDPYRNFNFR
jgi:hypothetical protein